MNVCKDRGVNLEELLQQKIQKKVSGLQVETGRKILYHGSKSGIKGAIAPISREYCDFGRGFYMGTEPNQPLTLVSDFEQSKFYVVSLDQTDLKTLRVKPDIEWAMLVAYHRGKMENT